MRQKYWVATLLPALLAWSTHFEAVQEKGNEALKQGHVKEAEELYSQFLKTASSDEIGFAKMQLAIVFYKDQEHEKAFNTFLEALDKAKICEKVMTNEERKVYDAAIKIYLDHGALSPQETAEKIASEFAGVYENNPHFAHLGFILAVGKANQGQYPQFFEDFYQSYSQDPNHFLAYKTKAALHIKLFERAKTDLQREEERHLILLNASEAVRLQPHDTSLYRMILGFTPEESKGAVLSTYLNKIIDKNIVIPRNDIPYYAEIAIAFEKYDLAQEFLDKSREWYAYSRVVSMAQQHLDDAKKGSYGN